MSRLTRNLGWNALGTFAPMLVALVTIPILIRDAGTARFGVLTLAWMVTGYFGLFDLGLGRAVTKLVSERLGTPRAHEIHRVVRLSMLALLVLGTLGGLVLAGLVPALSGSWLELPPALRAETAPALYLLALSVPLVVVSTGQRAVLEGCARFDLVNLLRLPLGVLNYLGPLVALAWSDSLAALVVPLVAGRLATVVLYAWMLDRYLPELRVPSDAPVPYPVLARELGAFAGWMTVSNVVGPLLLYLGRVFVAVMISAEAVAWFATPYEMIVKLLLVPGMAVAVLFPEFSRLAAGTGTAAEALYRRAMLAVLAAMLPLCAVVGIGARAGLELWIDAGFAQESYVVARWLAAGVFVNSFGHVCQAYLQGIGRPDLTAKLHLAELVAYVPYVWWLTGAYGIDGAAVAWTLRVTLSTIALVTMVRVCGAARAGGAGRAGRAGRAGLAG